VTAYEQDERRARELAANCERLGATVEVVAADARDASGGPYDRVLLDPPCSDLGTLQSRPDARWRKTPEQVEELAELQAELLQSAAAQVGPGGMLVYSTCTISPLENERQIETFLDTHAEFAADGRFIQLLPHRDGTDGFFIARLRKQ
jgi:16S rRNA (cytosine967-C5)-methyltransferase